MNPGRLLRWVAAFAAIAAAVSVCVVAAAFAVYALAESQIGPAGGAAVVVGVFALVAALVAWRTLRKASPKLQSRLKTNDGGPIDRFVQLAKDRPLIALGAAAAVGVVLVRNPAVISAVVTAFLAGQNTKSK